jgi:hypothetical protein
MDDFDEFAASVRAELIPKLKDSSVFLSIIPENDIDVKFAVELGVAIMLDKPIIACIRPGTKIPEKLARVVDRFVEIDPNSSDWHDRLKDVLTEMTS